MKGLRILYAALAMLLLLITGCGGATPEVPVAPGPAPAAPANSVNLPLYFWDPLGERIIPEFRQLPKGDAVTLANTVVRELLAGPTDPFLRTPFEVKLGLVEPVRIEKDVAYVNLDRWLVKEPYHGNPGWQGMAALSLSLTEIPEIRAVVLQVKGTDRTSELDRMFNTGEMSANPERMRYLQDRIARGLDTWRTDPKAVLEKEARMFGFTAEQLRSADLKVEGDRAVASGLKWNIYTYSVELARYTGGQGPDLWYVRSCTVTDGPLKH